MAVASERRLILRARLRNSSTSCLSPMLSSPTSMLRVPRAAIEIQVFSRACINPSPAIQMGKKMTARDGRGAP